MVCRAEITSYLRYNESMLVCSTNKLYFQQAEDYNVLVIGVPNVGKSSIINALRQTHMHRGNLHCYIIY